MRSGGQTTVIQRILERRASTPPTIQEDTSATIAIMLRVLPPPRALLVIADLHVQERIERELAADVLDVECVETERIALTRVQEEVFPVVITDSLELVRQIRSKPLQRAPFILYIAELDDGPEREGGLNAGADDSVGRRVSSKELEARIAIARRVAELEAVLRIALVENRKLSTTDDLTRVASRRFFSKHFPREVERAARYGRSLSLILCDIDHFKNINDSRGHVVGDDVLRQFGARLQASLRRGLDWVARIGGEEFAIVLPETGYEQALSVARKLRAAIANKPFALDRVTVEITASFGLCGLERVTARADKIADSMLKVADAALYRSKNGGRNRVTATMLPAEGEVKGREPRR